jgi:hypothetical protein
MSVLYHVGMDVVYMYMPLILNPLLTLLFHIATRF